METSVEFVGIKIFFFKLLHKHYWFTLDAHGFIHNPNTCLEWSLES